MSAVGMAECPPKKKLHERPLLKRPQAVDVVALFRALGDGTRLRLVHALARDGELCVTDLTKAVGMKPQAVSNQLRRLVTRGVLSFRRDGSHVYYRIHDPCVIELLDRALCLIEDAKERRRRVR